MSRSTFSRLTTSAPGRTCTPSAVSRRWVIAGGTYALERSLPLAVRYDGREGTIPCPDLAGALVVKAAAAVADHGLGPERHLSDLAVLFSLVADPFSLRSELGPRNARRIAADVLDDDEHPAWLLLPPSRRLEAITARALIIATAP